MHAKIKRIGKLEYISEVQQQFLIQIPLKIKPKKINKKIFYFPIHNKNFPLSSLTSASTILLHCYFRLNLSITSVDVVCSKNEKKNVFSLRQTVEPKTLIFCMLQNVKLYTSLYVFFVAISTNHFLQINIHLIIGNYLI